MFNKIIGRNSDAANTIAIYVPSTINIGINGDKLTFPAPPEIRDALILGIQRAFSVEFGGFTTYDNVCGGWVDPDTGGVVTENVTVIETYVSAPTRVQAEGVVALAGDVRDALNQDAVTLRVNDQTWFV